jgi:SH3-like domain-containing protein
VIVTAEVNGEEISASTELQVPSTYQSAFYESPPTPTPARPTPRPTPTDAPEPTPEEEQEPTATPEPQPAPGAVAAAVGNGGNVRAEPNAGAAVVGQVAINDSVEVLEKTADDIWYRIRFGQDDVTGWAHYAVLLLEQDVINQIPVQGAATTPDPTAPPVDDGSDAPADPASTGLMVDVFNGGNVRSEPSLNSRAIVDQVNAGERVELLQKTSDSVWYQITTERDTTGWVHNSLLTIPDEIAAQVPVQG